jgi:hypothetical protein
VERVLALLTGFDETGMQAGTVVPALDAGARFFVFPRHGNRDWLNDLVIAAVAVAMIALSICRWIKRRRDTISPAADEWSAPQSAPAQS